MIWGSCSVRKDRIRVEQLGLEQDECLGNKDEEGVVKERTPEESDLAHRSEDLEERVNYESY
ncbi:hypothetical protein H5410_015970 [Solanum commersonii]|uniref:Uncharacterized protein n=1 Tax=Solanum commersonii TaxID=4109 RepID=A0A9J5ZW06_SOLCO|nr:hypothetical protein H5410_015970 [Solanum commersonii]